LQNKLRARERLEHTEVQQWIPLSGNQDLHAVEQRPTIGQSWQVRWLSISRARRTVEECCDSGGDLPTAQYENVFAKLYSLTLYVTL
jgi:hypothetical protein